MADRSAAENAYQRQGLDHTATSSTADARSLLELSILAHSRSPSTGSPSNEPRPELSGEEEGDDKERTRGGYRCSKCGKPKKGHVCPTGSTGYSSLTFIGYDDSNGAEDPEKRRRFEMMEREIARLNGENAQLRSALQSYQHSAPHQSNQSAFAPNNTHQSYNANNSSLPSTASLGVAHGMQRDFGTMSNTSNGPSADHDAQPPSKRPRYDIMNASPSSTFNYDMNYYNSHVNQPVSLGGLPSMTNSFVVNSPSPQPINQQFPPLQHSHSQSNSHSHSPSMSSSGSSQEGTQMSMPSAEHAWLRIPKPQTQTRQ